jgi:hypothetical protein
MELSKHAQTRCRQRSIPPLIREWLQLYGTEQRSHGATKRFFDRTSRKRLAADVGTEVVDRLGDLLNSYIVEADTVIVTAAIRTRRIKRL